MKRFIVILLVIQILLLTGCTLPFVGEISKPPDSVEKQDMLTAPAAGWMNTQQGSQAGITGNGISIASLESTPGAVSSATSAGALIQTAEAELASGTAISSEGAISSEAAFAMVSTGTAVAGETFQASQELLANAAEASETRYPVTVYYQDGDGCLIPMTRWVQMQQGIARSAVSLCIDSAIAREEVAYYGVYPVIPVDTVILGLSIRDGLAVIDFDKHLLEYNGAKSEKNIVTSIVYTLTEFKNISGVRILVNGYPQGVLKNGTDISQTLRREDVAINTQTAIFENGSGKVDVFLFKKANEGFTYMAPVSVPVVSDSVEPDTNAEAARVLLKQLLVKDGENGTFSEMPDNVEILNCSIENGVLTLNLGEGFTKYGGNEKEESILKQLAYTMRQLEGVRLLKILVDGHAVQLPEGTDISIGLAIPATINDVMDR
jgi:germination protein M